jgi:hypothetical protein
LLTTPLRHAAVDLHRRQMRSPAHSLRNGDLQTRHGLVLGSVSRTEVGFLWSSSIASFGSFSARLGGWLDPSRSRKLK